jgi:hypothetical protein
MLRRPVLRARFPSQRVQERALAREHARGVARGARGGVESRSQFVGEARQDVARRAREVDVDGGDVADALARHRAGVAD